MTGEKAKLPRDLKEIENLMVTKLLEQVAATQQSSSPISSDAMLKRAEQLRADTIAIQEKVKQLTGSGLKALSIDEQRECEAMLQRVYVAAFGEARKTSLPTIPHTVKSNRTHIRL